MYRNKDVIWLMDELEKSGKFTVMNRTRRNRRIGLVRRYLIALVVLAIIACIHVYMWNIPKV